MRDFKFLSIQAHVDCAQRFLKNLTPGIPYEFYQQYSEQDNDDQHYAEDDLSTQEVPPRLYNVNTLDKSELQVNISAIVGKNGTGKSSIIELLFAALYVFSVQTRTHRENIQSLNKSKAKLIAKNDVSSIEKIGEIDQKLNNILEIINGVKCLLTYSVNGTVFKLDINSIHQSGFDLSIPALTAPIGSRKKDIIIGEELALEHFFYTIAVNYSHYALNSRHIGNWIDKLFHKNDGYKVPVVITPMREEGNFNINTEMHLAKSRLLSNIMTQRSNLEENKPIFISDNQFIDRITLKLNYQKLEKYFYLRDNKITGNERKTNMAIDLYRTIFPDDDYGIFINQTFLKQITANYITHKIDRISDTYEGFEKGYTHGEDRDETQNTAFFKSIIDEPSHISFKIRRAVNFLNKLHQNGSNDLFEAADYSDTKRLPLYQLTVEQLYQWMGKPSPDNVPHTLPPSFFDIDFELKNDSQDIASSFDSLSSGEMHLIHTVQSVVYHINNLQSAHASVFPRPRYRFVNIVLDEIELYFHPELQRRFINEIRVALSRLHRSGESNIEGINILMLTHSPFILSDIPAQNVLLLETDLWSKKSVPKKSSFQTFAGNINEILSDSFFLDNSLMGKFAEEKIKSLVQINMSDVEDKQLLSIIGDTFLKSHIEEYRNG